MITTALTSQSLTDVAEPQQLTRSPRPHTLAQRLRRAIVGLVAALSLFGSAAVIASPAAEAAPVQHAFTCSDGEIFFMVGVLANANVVGGGQKVSVRYYMEDAYGRSYLSGWDTTRWTPQYGVNPTGWSKAFYAPGWVGVTLMYQVAYLYSNGWAYSGWYTINGYRLCDPGW